MHLILTFSSVIMLMNSVTPSTAKLVQDLSYKCTNGRMIFLYLTNGMGSTDTSIVMIAHDGFLNCTVRYLVYPKNYVMLSVEFPDWIPYEPLCVHKNNSLIVVSNDLSVNICRKDSRHSFSYSNHLEQNFISVVIACQKDMNTIKLTATSLRDSNYTKCDSDKEVECVFKNTIYCMSSATQCNEQTDCGSRNMFVESKEQCEVKYMSPMVIIFSLIMLIITFCLLVSVFINLMPKRKATFVYVVDKATSLFDNEMEKTSVEIHVQVIFPEEDETEFLRKRSN